MGKVIRAQRMGKIHGKAPSHRAKGEIKHPALYTSKKEKITGEVTELRHDPGRSAPIARINYENGEKVNIIAPMGLGVRDIISYGEGANIAAGSTLSLGKIPEGTLTYNVENIPGDGGKFGRSAGNYVRVVTHDTNGTVVQLPSGAFKTLNSNCRANIGVVAGGGRSEKPLVKAGRKHFKFKARGKQYPWVSGVNMTPQGHPFGGGNHPHTGKPITISRHAPPGRKIGSIAAKRTGKRR